MLMSWPLPWFAADVETWLLDPWLLLLLLEEAWVAWLSDAWVLEDA